jgi:DNA polymerase I-like protein with 3'-5' exonuclease and polymerase domains
VVAQKAPKGTLQWPLFPPETNWQPPDMGTPPSWADARRVAIDVETRDPDLKELGPSCRRGGGYVVGVSYAIEDGPKAYLPIRHQGGDNLPVDAVLRYLRDQAKCFTGILVGANMQYDLDWLATEGIEYRPKFFRDIQIADPLINEHHDRYSLAAIAERWGLPGKNEDLLKQAARDHGVDPKAGLWQLPARYVAEYGADDASVLHAILRRQEREIEDQDLWRVYDLESQVLPVLVAMRRRGVRFSWERLEGIEKWSIEEEAKCLGEVRHHTGVRIEVGDVWKGDLVAQAIGQLGIHLHETATGKASVTKDVLAGIDHPAAQALARARKVNKLRTTFAASIRRFAVGDRIHCTFNQLRRTDDENETEKGAAYGRLSSELPNLQQQPARDEIAKPWRKIYLPEEGKLWAACDYSQQEPRWLVHFAEIMGKERADVAAQRYRDDPSTDNHDMMTRMIYGGAVDTWTPPEYKRMRGFCKEIFLGKCYGMGGAKLCMKLGLPTAWTVYWTGRWDGSPQKYATRDEAWQALANGGGDGRVAECAGEEGQAIMDKFDLEAPFVRATAKAAQKRAEQRGYIATWSGRRCRFPKRDDGSYDWTHKALNRLIQGCSADQTKAAMVAMAAEGIELQLQVHDEIDWSVADRAEAERGAKIMAEVIPLRVPMKVDVEVGPSWGEAA